MYDFHSFTFILHCEQNSNNNQNICIYFLKISIKSATIYFNNESLKPNDHFSGFFNIYFSFSWVFKALKTFFLIQCYPTVFNMFKACAIPVYIQPTTGEHYAYLVGSGSQPNFCHNANSMEKIFSQPCISLSGKLQSAQWSVTTAPI